MKSIRARFWIEATLAVISGFVLVLTLTWPQWIEAIFGVDPDGGSGSLEVVVSVALVAVTLAWAVLARLEWRRSSAPAT